MPILKCFTTKEVAALCRVSNATVKRWEAAGILHSERTRGGHRRFRADEIARFQRENNLGLKQCHGDNSIIKANLRRRSEDKRSDAPIFPLLLHGCETEAANLLISEYLKNKKPSQIFDELICPAMCKIGELWADGKLNIAEEHLATRTACNAVHKFRIALSVPKSSGKLVMCCAVEKDFHELPTFLAQVIFESEGSEVINFGANMPFDCFARQISKHQPDAVCISATFTENSAKFADNYQNFMRIIEKTGTLVVLGGRMFSDFETENNFSKAIFIESFAALEHIHKNLCSDQDLFDQHRFVQ